jgi:hypothetical protein
MIKGFNLSVFLSVPPRECGWSRPNRPVSL